MVIWAAVALVLFGLTPGLLAQGEAPQDFTPVFAGEESDIIKVDVARVPLLFTVTDRKNRFITDLGREDFTVYDDGWEQEIREFDRESDLPLRIGVILDTSNSIRPRFKFEQEAAIEFVHEMLADENDRAFLVSFDTQAELIVDYTSDIEELADGVRNLRAGGGTALYDAIYYASRDKLPEDQPKEQFRRTLVVIGDGQDNRSSVTREDALEMVHKAEAVVYTISTNRSGAAAAGDKTLRRFATETGGVAFHPLQARDLQQSFSNIANELRHQYFILYSPAQFVNDGSFHTVEVRTRHRNATVRVRRGYYAPLPDEGN